MFQLWSYYLHSRSTLIGVAKTPADEFVLFSQFTETPLASDATPSASTNGASGMPGHKPAREDLESFILDG